MFPAKLKHPTTTACEQESNMTHRMLSCFSLWWNVVIANMVIHGPYIICTAFFTKGHGFNANIISNVWLHNQVFLRNVIQKEKYDIKGGNIVPIYGYMKECNTIYNEVCILHSLSLHFPQIYAPFYLSPHPNNIKLYFNTSFYLVIH